MHSHTKVGKKVQHAGYSSGSCHTVTPSPPAGVSGVTTATGAGAAAAAAAADVAVVFISTTRYEIWTEI